MKLLLLVGLLSVWIFSGAAMGLEVVCTTGMVGDMVRFVAGERAKVSVLMADGIDPHLYKPTRDDVAKMLKADVVFYSGLHLEGRMDETFEKIAKRKIAVAAVTDSISPNQLLKEGTVTDPHVWMDPALWAECVKTVRKTLSAKDPAGEAVFRANADRYTKELNNLSVEMKQLIATIPEEQRLLITAHDAFQYFSRATGLAVSSIQGLSTASEAGVADINRLVDLIVKRRIPAIFVESTLSEKNVRAVIEGAKARGQDVRLGGMLYSDSMGAAGTPTGSYSGMIQHNVTTITEALGGWVSGGVKP